jgi:Uma2 family endonuclease
MSTVHTRTTRRLKLDQLSNGMLMTPEEFDAVTDYDEQYVYELIHGVVIVVPAPGEAKRDPNDELGFWLRLHEFNRAEESLLDKTLPEQYLPVPNGRRRADRVIWTGLGRVPVLDRDIPSIVIEFVSNRERDRTRDYEEKRREYLALGVREYWIIDRFDRRMTVFRNDPAGPAEVVVKADETYRTPLLPGFGLPLAKLLKVADDWADPARPRTKRPGRKRAK